MADLQRVFTDDDTLDDELQDRLAFGERGLPQASPDALAKGGEVRQHLLGMGALNVTGLNQSDYELVLAIQLFYTIISLVGILITDISYGLIDPRVRVDK